MVCVIGGQNAISLQIRKSFLLGETEQDTVWAFVPNIDNADSVDWRNAVGDNLFKMIKFSVIVSVQNIESESDIDTLCDHVLAQRWIYILLCHRNPTVSHGRIVEARPPLPPAAKCHNFLRSGQVYAQGIDGYGAHNSSQTSA